MTGEQPTRPSGRCPAAGQPQTKERTGGEMQNAGVVVAATVAEVVVVAVVVVGSSSSSRHRLDFDWPSSMLSDRELIRCTIDDRK